jgi:hypothetical protein
MVVGDMVDGLTLTNKMEPIFYEGCAFGKCHQNHFPKTNYEFKQMNLLELGTY